MFEQDSSASLSVGGLAIAEASGVHRATTPGLAAAEPDRSRALFVGIFVASLAAHATLALRMASASSGNLAHRVRSEVEIQMTRPPPPVQPIVPPDPVRPAPPERPLLRRAASRTVERPVDAPPQSDVSGPEGTDDPTPPSSGDAPVSPVAIAPPPPAPPPPPIVEAKEGANYLKNPRPAYPHLAQREGWEGVVLLRVQVQPDGRVGSISLARSSGHAVLDDAARSAVEGWAFVPATRGGSPTSGWVSVPVEFRLQ